MREGSGWRASVRPRLHRIISPRRRVARDACLRARSLRYAAGLRRAVTRHVWRDRRCFACAWCSVNTGFCATSVSDNVHVLIYQVTVYIKDFDDATSSGSAQPVSSGAYRRPRYRGLTHFRPRPIRQLTVQCLEIRTPNPAAN